MQRRSGHRERNDDQVLAKVPIRRGPSELTPLSAIVPGVACEFFACAMEHREAERHAVQPSSTDRPQYAAISTHQESP
jgi:hypothetical protein